jgi:hypothetical protein
VASSLHLLGTTLGLIATCALGQSSKTLAPLPIVASTRLQLVAEVEAPTPKIGDPIILKLRLVNTSSKPVSFLVTWDERDYQALIVDASGKEPPKTAFGEKSYDPRTPLFRSETVTLGSGQDLKVDLDITKVFQLTQPGAYSAVVMRKVFGETKEDQLARDERTFSNRVSFTIVR